MSRSLARQKVLARYLTARRKEARLTQQQVADKLGRYQSFVATVESGQRRIDLFELLELALAIGFDPIETLNALKLDSSFPVRSDKG